MLKNPDPLTAGKTGKLAASHLHGFVCAGERICRIMPFFVSRPGLPDPSLYWRILDPHLGSPDCQRRKVNFDNQLEKLEDIIP